MVFMGIERDLSSLVRTPDEQPWLAKAIGDAWFKAHREDSRAPTDPTAMHRFSSSGMCTRSMRFRHDGVDESNPPDLPALYRMWLGTLTHEWVDLVDPDGYEMEREVEVVLEDGEFRSSGHVDLVLTDRHQQRTVVEFKTVNDFSFRAARFGARKGENPEGPKISHLAQLALAAKAVGAQYGIVLYFTMQPFSPANARSWGLDDVGRLAAQWTFTSDELHKVYVREKQRMLAAEKEKKPLILLESSTAEIIDPRAGSYVDDQGVLGQTWHCDYCNYRDHCVSTWGADEDEDV